MILSAMPLRTTETRLRVRSPSGVMMESTLRSSYPRMRATLRDVRSWSLGVLRNSSRMAAALASEESSA